jgi:hypothetical protein
MQVGESATQSRIVAATLAVLICGGLAFLFNIAVRPLFSIGGLTPVGEAFSLLPVLFLHPTYEALEKRHLHPFRIAGGGLRESLRKSVHPAHDRPWILTALAWAAALAITVQLVAFITAFVLGVVQLPGLLTVALFLLFFGVMGGISLGFGLKRVPYGIRTLAVMAYIATGIGYILNWTLFTPAEWQAELGLPKTMPWAAFMSARDGTLWLAIGLVGFGVGRLISRKRKVPAAAPAPAPLEDNSRLVFISPDARHVWNGADWQPLTLPVSPDRRYVWDGVRWVAARVLPPPP